MVLELVFKVLLLVVIGFLLIQLIKYVGRAFVLVINTVLGLLALFLAVALGIDIPINVWTVLLSSVGGLIGFAIVLLLHIGGWLF